MKRIIIVGGGFAGLNLAKRLSGKHDLDVVLVDKNNYHFFPPLLYQVSTAFIEPSNISYPFRKVLQNSPNVRFFMGELLAVEPTANRIRTSHGTLAYDYLVLAIGAEVNFFGNENLRRNALPMKTIDDALRIRNHILLKMEEAARTTSEDERTVLTNIVLAGGGPTGVEMAGMIAEMARGIIAQEYPETNFSNSRIYLVDGGSVPLKPMSETAQRESRRVLTELGVEILAGTLVSDYKNNEVILSSGKIIPAATLIWCSGVVAARIEGIPSKVLTKANRILVNEINQIEEFPNIFAIGDLCYQTSDEKFRTGHPQVAQVAIQQGKRLAYNLSRLVQRKKVRPFVYQDRGKMAIISKYRAVVDFRHGSIHGLVAWLIWLFIHLVPLISFRNRTKVLLNWGLSFITKDAGLRLIIRPDVQTDRQPAYVGSRVQ